MTIYELLDLLIAELDQLRADNRRLKFERALGQLRADNRRLNLELAAVRSQLGVTGRPELWWGGPSNYSDVD